MQVNLSVAGKTFVAAADNSLLLARISGSPEIVGVAVELESSEGIAFPSFHVEVGDKKMPVVPASDTGMVVFEPLNVTASEYFAGRESRRKLASFADEVREKMGWGANKFYLLNAVYWLERYNINEITDENAQEAAEACRDVYLMLIDYCDAQAVSA